MHLVFSKPVSAIYKNLRDHAITASNGRVPAEGRVNGSSAEWKVTVAPSSREAVTVIVSGGSDACRQRDTVCTEDGRWLSNSPSVTAEGPPAVSLTAELDGVPEEHDGKSTFTFGLTFSEEPRVSYRTMSHPLSASVRGPAAMSVSDARVEEAASAAVAFAVTLSRAASDRVTVDYQTRDGSAQGGEDYGATSGMLTFSAGTTTKTIAVAVLDDADDEGEVDVHAGAVERVAGVAGGGRGDRGISRTRT